MKNLIGLGLISILAISVFFGCGRSGSFKTFVDETRDSEIQELVIQVSDIDLGDLPASEDKLILSLEVSMLDENSGVLLGDIPIGKFDISEGSTLMEKRQINFKDSETISISIDLNKLNLKVAMPESKKGVELLVQIKRLVSKKQEDVPFEEFTAAVVKKEVLGELTIDFAKVDEKSKDQLITANLKADKDAKDKLSPLKPMAFNIDTRLRKRLKIESGSLNDSALYCVSKKGEKKVSGFSISDDLFQIIGKNEPDKNFVFKEHVMANGTDEYFTAENSAPSRETIGLELKSQKCDDHAAGFKLIESLKDSDQFLLTIEESKTEKTKACCRMHKTTDKE